MTSPAFLLPVCVILPLLGAFVVFASGRWNRARVVLSILPFGLLMAVLILRRVVTTDAAVTTALSGFAPPLGIALRADGLSAVLLVLTAIVLGAIALYSRAALPARGRMPDSFWFLLLSCWCALNLAFLANDLFTLFVALEVLTFSAVPLVCLEGGAATVRAALRYLMFALFGSVLYLLGAALFYGVFGTLDIALIASLARAGPPGSHLVTGFALAVMVAGLAAKAALFPFHLWLPPAHAGAPAPASALLSALVIKAPIFLILRLMADLAPATPAVGQVLGGLGAGAIVICGLFALRQTRLKLLIAYSTAAQVGYIFLIFPLADASTPWISLAWTAGVLHMAAHAMAKAAMFLAAGIIAEVLGHDRISGLGGAARVLPVTLFAFGLGGLSLMGLPPSGGFNVKVMLLTAAVQHHAWGVALVVVMGGLLAAGYVLKVILPALARQAPVIVAPVPRARQTVALALAIGALLLGLTPLKPAHVLAIGRPVLSEGMP